MKFLKKLFTGKNKDKFKLEIEERVTDKLREALGITDSELKEWDEQVVELYGNVNACFDGGLPPIPIQARAPITLKTGPKKRFFDCYFLLTGSLIELLRWDELSEGAFKLLLEEKRREAEAIIKEQGQRPEYN